MTRQSRDDLPFRGDIPSGDDIPSRSDPGAESLAPNDMRRVIPAMPHHYAQELTGGGKVAQIQHGDQVYTLRITRAEKLILTK